MKMNQKGWVREELSARVSRSIEEAKKYKDAESWWDSLPGKLKRKVVKILGLSSVSGKTFSQLSGSVRSEIKAYFEKHAGMVESA